MLFRSQSTGINVKATAGSNGTARNTGSSRKTGIVAGDKLNNVFDIFGLRKEWTLEADSTDRRASRGGFYRYNGNVSPSNRNYGLSDYTYDYYGSRPTLLIQ